MISGFKSLQTHDFPLFRRWWSVCRLLEWNFICVYLPYARIVISFNHSRHWLMFMPKYMGSAALYTLDEMTKNEAQRDVTWIKTMRWFPPMWDDIELNEFKRGNRQTFNSKNSCDPFGWGNRMFSLLMRTWDIEKKKERNSNLYWFGFNSSVYWSHLQHHRSISVRHHIQSRYCLSHHIRQSFHDHSM